MHKPPRLHVHQWGDGPRVVLIHGALLGGRQAWRAQRPLTQRWTLLAPDRPGHGQSPAGPTDFEREAELVAEQLLIGPAHLVGLSYGAIVAMYAAAYRPDPVQSLTVIEPPATGIIRGDPDVDAFGAAIRDIIESVDTPPEVALPRFLELAGAHVQNADPIPQVLLSGMRQLQGARPPDEADPPLDRLRESNIPILVVSGRHMRVYEAICDALAAKTGARRAHCPGMGHLVPDTGEPFNRLLEEFFSTTPKAKPLQGVVNTFPVEQHSIEEWQ